MSDLRQPPEKEISQNTNGIKVGGNVDRPIRDVVANHQSDRVSGTTEYKTSQNQNDVTSKSDGKSESCTRNICCKTPTFGMLYKVRRSTVRVWMLGVFMLSYVLLGSLIFVALEDPVESDIRRTLREERSTFLEDHPCLNDTELEDFITNILAASQRGVSAARNVTGEPNWSFGQSVFFAWTVLTTIGYGHVTPLSEGGKVFCIVYAAIGIPLTLIMFTALVERLMVLTTRLLQALTDQLGHLYKTIHIRLIHLSIIVATTAVFIFVIPSALLTLLEDNWNFLDAFYYCFISLTTVGLGDYIPGDQPEQTFRPLYKICVTFYLFLGLVMMMLTLANIYNVPELNLGYHFYMRSDEDQSERATLRTGEPVTKYTQHVNRAYSQNADEYKQKHGAYSHSDAPIAEEYKPKGDLTYSDSHSEGRNAEEYEQLPDS